MPSLTPTPRASRRRRQQSYMTATRTETKPWDFSHVFDVVNSLSATNASSDEQHDAASGDVQGLGAGKALSHGIDIHDFGTPPPKLGDFAKIWQYLGTPQDSPVPDVPSLTNEPLIAADLPAKLDYTSDGATFFRPVAKSVKGVSWEDEEVAGGLTTDTATDRSASPDTPESPQTPSLTKTQRKKQRKKERKAKEAAEALKNATVSESEADTRQRKTPARKASAHMAKSSASPVPTRVSTPTLSQPSHASAVAHSIPASVEEATARVAAKLAELKNTKTVVPANTKPATRPQRSQAPTIKRQMSQPVPVATAAHATPTHTASHHPQTQQWPATPSNVKTTRMLPSSVQPPAQSTALPISTQPVSAPHQAMTPTAKKPRFVIEPKIVRSGEDRHWALLMKLIGDFWEDRKHIISPMNLTTHNNDPTGIHIFVDASNIFIGFTDQLKRSRGIPQYAQVPQVDLSFDALALLMERRRPVAKRVLAGSTPHMPAFDKAKAVGYECSILEKVYKARELTERQIYFRDHDHQGRPLARNGAKAPAATNVAALAGTPSTPVISHGQGSGSGSGSEMAAPPQYAPARMIEQGVDEILHLKILESVVDSEEPSTIVLATGDAAQAEYSPGFMKMIERALKKGWKVELVSWSKNISGMYRKPEWLARWGEQFRVVYLDDYAEELLEM
ncbi:hypothetical protein LTR53_003840 [Teratosphaeriaceae sp. CCFEE 6253]|nr:hypothetical protein LTR53_003840 [Teratosphaeriaceae sp. CCFEE 6253]